jgi:UDP-N-acetylmuramoyl-tripeptide--D-alanyl-D-alanine ligase
MIPLDLAEIAEIVSGRLAGGADPGAVVSAAVEFDSRKVAPGGLFLALPGERVDGHDFASAAIAAGAVAVIASRNLDVPCIVVADGRAALAALAAAVSRRLPGLTIIGITGSSGKTSTKDLVAGLLSELGPTVAPPGSFNNELGHPYTVCLATARTRYLVLETSARGVGHIRYLTGIARPQIGVVLNVGSAHLGEFGSQAAIAQAKGELVEALPSTGLAVLNADDPLVLAMAARTQARVVTVGQGVDADIRAGDVRLDECARAAFTLRTAAGAEAVALQLVGAHQVGNTLAAAAVALECGMPQSDVARLLSQARPVSRWRMEVTHAGGVTVINDTYNANPESMAAALRSLAAIRATQDRPAGRTGRSWAVLGQMAELGAEAAARHEAVGQLVAQLGIARLVVVGEAARPILDGAHLEGSWTGQSSWVPDAVAATEALRAQLRPGDVVLVKASRAASLERVAVELTDDQRSREEGAP